MTLDHHPVQNSEVYILASAKPAHTSAIPPPSPPLPATQCKEPEISPPTPPLVDLMSITPPDLLDTYTSLPRHLARAVHVLGTEATALSYLTQLYETDPIARSGFDAAVKAITRYEMGKGKLIICGIGKSGHIAKKLVATMNSLQIHASYLHPTEALHGDLGIVGKFDTILLITFSGKTPELLTVLPHFNASVPLIIMTSHTNPSTCEIIRRRPDAILLPAPIHKSETDSFGFNAPTTSTTMALALGDALAVVISSELYINVQDVFSRNHPGGAIGISGLAPVAAAQSSEMKPLPTKQKRTVYDLAVQFDHIPDIGNSILTGGNILMAAYRSESGWLRQSDDLLISPRRVRRLGMKELSSPVTELHGLMVQKTQWLKVPADTEIEQAQDIVRQLYRAGRDARHDTVLAIIYDGHLYGVLELGDLIS